MALIEVEHVTREFVLHKQDTGFSGMLGSLLKGTKTTKRAVDDVTFSVNQGELVGYIGPNGAGKSTTIKMLTGILTPTCGRISVNGIVPYERRRENAKSIGVMFGQRSQLWWDLPPMETYNLLRHMYRIDKGKFDSTIKLLGKLLDLDEFQGIPVRQLSLGQRMRAEIVASLLHRPKILYLDEPTIGMDIMIVENIRQFLKDINRHENTTIILATHDMEEVERLCSRIIAVNHGRIVFDGTISELRSRCRGDSILTVEFQEETLVERFEDLTIHERSGRSVSFLFNRQHRSAADIIRVLGRDFNVKDIVIKDPPIDVIIKELYETSEDEGGLMR